MGPKTTIEYQLGTMRGIGSAPRVYPSGERFGMTCNNQIYAMNLYSYLNMLFTCGKDKTCQCSYLTNFL